jgi:hypothetical protein
MITGVVAVVPALLRWVEDRLVVHRFCREVALLVVCPAVVVPSSATPVLSQIQTLPSVLQYTKRGSAENDGK